MSQNLLLRPSVIVFFFLFQFNASAATFTSAKSGNWFDATTWVEAGFPTASDDVLIADDHEVTITGGTYTFYGNIVIAEKAMLMVDAGDSDDGLIFCGKDFHVFGSLFFTADKDFALIGTSHFWGHPNAAVYISDDWKISQHTVTTLESICVRVGDDFQLTGTDAIVCGEGGITLEGSSFTSTFEMLGEANISQLCLETTIYRSTGGSSCGEFFKGGYGNTSPVAIDDEATTEKNTAIDIDVLYQGTPDNDLEGSDLTIRSAGTDYSYNGLTQKGGTVSINDNDTPSDPTDDFIQYTPPTDYIGTDQFMYIITDGKGGFDYANVTVEVTLSLPVELVHFSAEEAGCEITLSWATAMELNNSHFELERSVDGFRFAKIGQVAGNGTTNQYRVYDFKDEMPIRENYYRLKQIDYNGTTTYSNVIFVKSECVQNENRIGMVDVFPNPVISGAINLRFEADLHQNELLTISDLYGKNILRQEVMMQAGSNRVAIDVAELSAGTYIMTLGQQTAKFIKARD